MIKYEGHCHCGAIHYAFAEEPINSVLCYCTLCQIRTGSDKWFGLWVRKHNFAFTQGTPAKYSRQGDSGNTIHQYYCADCTTTLCVEIPVSKIYSVAATTLPWQPSFAPKIAIYTASAAPWALFHEGVPKFETLPEEYRAKLGRA